MNRNDPEAQDCRTEISKTTRQEQGQVAIQSLHAVEPESLDSLRTLPYASSSCVLITFRYFYIWSINLQPHLLICTSWKLCCLCYGKLCTHIYTYFQRVLFFQCTISHILTYHIVYLVIAFSCNVPSITVHFLPLTCFWVHVGGRARVTLATGPGLSPASRGSCCIRKLEAVTTLLSSCSVCTRQGLVESAITPTEAGPCWPGLSMSMLTASEWLGLSWGSIGRSVRDSLVPWLARQLTTSGTLGNFI